MNNIIMSFLHLSILSCACAVVVKQTSFMEQPAREDEPCGDFLKSLDDEYKRGFEEGVQQTEKRLKGEHDAQIQQLQNQLRQKEDEANQIRGTLLDRAGVLVEKESWAELLAFWAGLPADTMNSLLGSTGHLHEMLYDASSDAFTDDSSMRDIDMWSTFISKITPENLGIHADGWNLLYVVTTFLGVADESKVELINRILSKMRPSDVVAQDTVNENGDHGTAFHKSTLKSLEIAKAFARHRNIPAGHFLIADQMHIHVPSNGENDILFPLLTPLMYSVGTENLDMPLMLLKAFIDKFCFKLKMLRMTCKFLSKALKRDEILPKNNSANVLFSLPKEVLTKIGQHVATVDIAHNHVGDCVLPDDSINLVGAHGNMSVQQVLSDIIAERIHNDDHANCNLFSLFLMHKDSFLSRDAAKTKKLEDMISNPMAFEELPFDY